MAGVDLKEGWDRDEHDRQSGHLDVTPSCGCVFCDVKLLPEIIDDGYFHVVDTKNGKVSVPCGNPP